MEEKWANIEKQGAKYFFDKIAVRDPKMPRLSMIMPKKRYDYSNAVIEDLAPANVLDDNEQISFGFDNYEFPQENIDQNMELILEEETPIKKIASVGQFNNDMEPSFDFNSESVVLAPLLEAPDMHIEEEEEDREEKSVENTINTFRDLFSGSETISFNSLNLVS